MQGKRERRDAAKDADETPAVLGFGRKEVAHSQVKATQGFESSKNEVTLRFFWQTGPTWFF